MEYKAGLKIGDYVLKECIDIGGEAQVWKASQQGHIVAVKLRQAAKLGSREDVNKLSEAFTNEKEQWIEFTRSSIYIVNILAILSEVLEDDSGTQWVVQGIVSEFSHLGDLHRVIENGEIRGYLKTEAQVLQFLLHIISGVRAGHDVQRYHCDIKPKNILLFRDSGHIVPKLTDFGIAGTALEPVKGYTPGYSAPELALRGAAPTAQSDVYSLGITFYDILYATILRPGKDVKTASAYKSGKDYKQYLTEYADDATQSKFAAPYKNLSASMAAEKQADRLTLDQVNAILLSSLAAVSAAGPQYKVKTKPDIYAWNPSVHEAIQEKLYYILVKGKNPTIDLRNIDADLRYAGFSGFSLRSVIGAWDYIIRIWIPQSSPTLQDAKSAIERTSRDPRDVKVLEVVKVHLTSNRPKKSAHATKLASKESDIQMLKDIEKCAGDEAYDKLRHAGYVVSQLNDESKSFRATLLVTIDRGFVELAPVIGVLIKDKIQQTDNRRVKELSYYEVRPIDDVDVRLVVQFMHANFIEFRATLLKVFETLVLHGNHFQFSTMLDANAKQDCLSDDGAIISRIKAVHSGIL